MSIVLKAGPEIRLRAVSSSSVFPVGQTATSLGSLLQKGKKVAAAHQPMQKFLSHRDVYSRRLQQLYYTWVRQFLTIKSLIYFFLTQAARVCLL